MTNKTIIFGSAIAIALVAGVLSSGMLAEAAPAPKAPQDVFVTNDVTTAIPVSVSGITSSPVCPQENVQHWIKVQFTATTTLVHDTLPDAGSNNEITILTDPALLTYLKADIADKLVSQGYTKASDGSPPTPGTILTIHNMEYSTICAAP